MLTRRALSQVGRRHLSQYRADFFLGHRNGKMDLFFNVPNVSLKGDNYFGLPELNHLNIVMGTDDKPLRPRFVNGYIKTLHIGKFGWFNDQLWDQHHTYDSQSIALLVESCSRADIEHAFQHLAQEIIDRERALGISRVPNGAIAWIFDYGV